MHLYISLQIYYLHHILYICIYSILLYSTRYGQSTVVWPVYHLYARYVLIIICICIALIDHYDGLTYNKHYYPPININTFNTPFIYARGIAITDYYLYYSCYFKYNFSTILFNDFAISSWLCHVCPPLPQSTTNY